MKRTKVLLALLMSLIMMVSLAACGDGQEEAQNTDCTPADEGAADNSEKDDSGSGDKVKITLMEWDSGVDNAVTEWEVFMDTFPEYKDKVEIEVVTGGSGPIDIMEMMRKMTASQETDEMPDIITCNWAQVPEYYEMGIIRDVTDVYNEIGDQVMTGVANLMQYKDQYMGFPAEVKTKIWAYRKDMFEEAGVDPNTCKTVDDLIEAGKKIQEVYPESYIENYTEVPQGYDLFAYFTGNGARLADEDGNYICASDPGVREAFEFYEKMRDSGVVSTTIQDFSEDWYSALSDGTLCSQVLAGWFASNHLPNVCPDLAGKWGLALWPEEIAAGSESGAKLMMVNDASPNADLCVEMLTKFCYSEENASALFHSPRGTIPYLKSCTESEEYLVAGDYFGKDRMETEFKAMDILSVYPYTPNSSLEETIIVQYLGEYLSGTMDLDTALKTAEEEMKAQIGNAYD